MPRLQDKVAVITGGESGIGLASARLFVSEGAKVHLIGIDGGKLAGAVSELGDDNALGSEADVTDEDAVRRAIGEGVDRYGRIDVLFSNAGISGEVAGITDYPSDVFARVQARPGRADASGGEGSRVAAHPRQLTAPGPDIDTVPGRHRDARDGQVAGRGG
jgi:NAD(P)-dependent dehydrogenase (short-subunit alcohol dehydrogenase family)